MRARILCFVLLGREISVDSEIFYCTRQLHLLGWAVGLVVGKPMLTLCVMDLLMSLKSEKNSLRGVIGHEVRSLCYFLNL